MNTQDEILQRIIAYTDHCHNTQMRRYTAERYIVHPVRVMQTCREYTLDSTILAAALLHDVLEDTPVQESALKQFLLTCMSDAEASRTLQLVIELTDVYTKVAYPAWNRQKRKKMERERLAHISPEAQTIKYADIIDNAPEIAREDPDFALRFLPEYRALLPLINKGHPQLYQRAITTVNACMVQQL